MYIHLLLKTINSALPANPISGQFIEKFQMINESSASIPMQAVKGVVLLRIITKDELIVKAVILM
jgi:hypothetical protein